MKFLIVGNGGRESAFARKLSEDTVLYAVMSHKNHTISECVESSGGEYIIGNPADPDTVGNYAVEKSVDYAFINTDEPLANGVVDALVERGIKAIGGTREATRIEWDKIYSIELMKRVCPEFTPNFTIVHDSNQVDSAISKFESQDKKIAVKPQGLTGGKGVKVMPEHLATYQDCKRYASELLEKNPEHGVLLVEKLYGIEFTIMGITDGKTLVMCPASYDYPFRNDGDTGPGTGGMGCFTNSENMLPFMTKGDLNDCKQIMQRVIDDMSSRGTKFQGVLNGGFFKTKDGIKFMEFNGRFGDPEGINILSILSGSFSKILISVWDGTLSEGTVEFSKKASVVKYMVGHEYPEPSEHSVTFHMDEDAVREMDVNLFFASCVKVGPGRYETLKKSRVVAFAALSDTVEDASSLIDRAVKLHFSGELEYRKDIGSSESLENLNKMAAKLAVN